MFRQVTKATFIEKIWNYETVPLYKKKDDALSCIVFFYIRNDDCLIQYDILTNIAAGFSDKLIVFQVDALKEQLLAADLGIRKTPALLFLFSGREPQIAYGLFSEITLSNFIKKSF
jgi:thioredoxin-like negative regulator of GroEL